MRAGVGGVDHGARGRGRPGGTAADERAVTAPGAAGVAACKEVDVTPGSGHRSTDRFPRLQALLFSQLLDIAQVGSPPPPNPRSTCTERVYGALRTLRGLATAPRRTSLHGPRVQRFVIECFTPSCHVDNVPHLELVTVCPRDPVDFDLDCLYGGGLVQDRGETCRSDTTEEPRPPRGA
ncbi:protein of unknown function [Streptomyces murinus]